MKRLALLLAAMGVISVGAMAEAPALKVTSIGQELEIENYSGNQNISDEGITFVTTVGLSYEDWTFAVQAGKFWTADTKEGIKSTNGRMQFDAWKQINSELKLGARYRGQKDYDRYYLRYNYSSGMFYSVGDFWYNSKNGNGTDTADVEAWPLGIKYDAFTLAWYVRGTTYLGNLEQGEKKDSLENQLRATWNFYQGEKLSLATEYRITVSDSVEVEGGKKEAGETSKYKSFERNRLYLRASYNATENLNVYGYYGYEINRREFLVNGEEDKSKNYYGDFGIGWNYKF